MFGLYFIALVIFTCFVLFRKKIAMFFHEINRQNIYQRTGVDIGPYEDEE